MRLATHGLLTAVPRGIRECARQAELRLYYCRASKLPTLVSSRQAGENEAASSPGQQPMRRTRGGAIPGGGRTEGANGGVASRNVAGTFSDTFEKEIGAKTWAMTVDYWCQRQRLREGAAARLRGNGESKNYGQ